MADNGDSDNASWEELREGLQWLSREELEAYVVKAARALDLAERDMQTIRAHLVQRRTSEESLAFELSDIDARIARIEDAIPEMCAAQRQRSRHDVASDGTSPFSSNRRQIRSRRSAAMEPRTGARAMLWQDITNAGQTSATIRRPFARRV
ncbi:MAG: hypothetical protein U1F23_03280 [Lysobacterales bacterium]